MVIRRQFEVGDLVGYRQTFKPRSALDKQNDDAVVGAPSVHRQFKPQRVRGMSCEYEETPWRGRYGAPHLQRHSAMTARVIREAAERSMHSSAGLPDQLMAPCARPLYAKDARNLAGSGVTITGGDSIFVHTKSPAQPELICRIEPIKPPGLTKMARWPMSEPSRLRAPIPPCRFQRPNMFVFRKDPEDGAVSRKSVPKPSQRLNEESYPGSGNGWLSHRKARARLSCPEGEGPVKST